MTRAQFRSAATAMTLLALALAPAAYAAPGDSAIPGVPLPASPAIDALDTAGRVRVVYRVSLIAGETLALSLATDQGSASANCDLDLYLYGPGATVVDHASAIAKATLPLYYPETVAYVAPVSGEYYVEVFAAEGSGPSRLTWSIIPEPLLPVYRFYNPGTGTHFYTPSEAERDQVIALWSNIYAYEGVAYHTKASKNPLPLYRFYNTRNGSHFYTASLDEANTVIGLYAHTYTFEGETYRVSPAAEPGKTPVFRFYNMRNGSHFYTASWEEADSVIRNYPHVYSFEGPAFYLGQ